jgi:transcriptional regulator with XRE-family HTH domain
MNPQNKENLSKLIKDARIAKGYTQQQLADSIRVNLRSVQRIENGEVVPRQYTLKLLAECLDINSDILYAGNTNKEEYPDKPFKRSLKIIISVVSGLLMVFLTAAFLSQSAKFPETSFELFLMLAAEIGIYGLLLWRIWR